MRRLLAVSLLLLAPLGAWATTAGVGAMYVLCNPADAVLSAPATGCPYAMTQAVTTGVRTNLQWQYLETADGTYNWTAGMNGGTLSIDTLWYNAKINGQKIEVALLAGTNTPSWVPGTRLNCGSDLVNYPVPWDPTFLAKYKAAIDAIKAHLAVVTNPGGGTVDVTSLVRIVEQAGLNNNTAEMYLQPGTPIPCTGGTTLSVDQTWRSAGFTPAVVKAAVASLLTTYVSDFPGVTLSFDVITPNAFSPIDDNGQIYVSPPGRMDELTRQIVSTTLIANPTVPFATQWNALSNVAPDPQPGVALYVAANNSHNDIMGWQMNQRGGAAGSWCNYSGTFLPCDGRITGTADGDFELMIDNGMYLGASYIEFWPMNVDQVTRVVANLKTKGMLVPN